MDCANLPRYHKRAFAHNYQAPFIYHIIIKKADRAECFGTVRGDARVAPGMPGCAYIEESLLGRIVSKAIVRLQYHHPILAIYKWQVMPDHAHFILRVKDWSEYHLDYFIEDLVSDISKSYSKAIGKHVSKEELLQPGYCDKPLLLNRSLDGLYKYIEENPHRLAMRRQFPQFFQTVRKFRIGDRDFAAYGNLFLFRNPDKEAVKISSKYTEEKIEEKKRKWLADVARGTVLVSPFISRKEKEIRKEAEEAGAMIILITAEAFGERYKPARHDFELCCEGRLLIISLGLAEKTTTTRELCERMNRLASEISVGH